MAATYTAREAAAMLGVSRVTVYRQADAGLLPVVCRSPLRISRAGLDALVRADGWAPEPVRQGGTRITHAPAAPYESKVLQLVAAERKQRKAAR